MKTFFKIIFIVCLSLLAPKAFAARLYFNVPSTVLNADKDVTLPLMLDAEGTSINALEGRIQFPSNLTYKDVSTGGSIVPMWLEKPQVAHNIINFSGIIPGGFEGIIDPFKGNVKSPGVVMYVTFHTSANAGIGAVTSASGTKAYVNDGKGTEIALPLQPLNYSISKTVQQEVGYIPPSDNVSPTSFTVTLSQDPLLYDGHYFIVFKSDDKGSGIDHYEVQEGASGFKRATSPYLLSRQSLGVPIVVKAVDKAGNVQFSTIEPGANTSLPSDNKLVVPLIFLVLVLLFAFRRKLFGHLVRKS